MLTRIVIGAAGAAAVWLAGAAGAAPAEPTPEPTLPNVNAYTPISPVDYTVMNGNWYAFAGPGGVTCVLNRQSGGYGCSGPLPGSPGGANLVSAGASGPPGFSTTERPIFAAAGEVKPLPPNTRLSFRDISCGADAGGTVACVNAREQVGFIVGPAGTFVSSSNPLLDRPEGTNPYFPAMPPG